LFHTYSVWIVLGLTVFWLPTARFTISGLPVVFDTHVGTEALKKAAAALPEV
jgi:hypothetical protein